MGNDTTDKDRTIRELHQQVQEKSHVIRDYAQVIQDNAQVIREKDHVIQEKDHVIQENAQVIQEKDHVISEKVRLIRDSNRQLQDNEQVVAEFQQTLAQREKENRDLRESLSARDSDINDLQRQLQHLRVEQPQAKVGSKMAEKRSIKLRWRDGGRAPEKMYFGSCAADGHMAYFRNHYNDNVNAHNGATGKWNKLPMCPYQNFDLVVVNGVLTAVGGYSSGNYTNKLFSLVGEGKWVEQLPCMPTKRYNTAAVCSGKTLVVIGGSIRRVYLKTVELLDIDSLQWFIASELPHPLSQASATVCGDNLYLVSGWGDINNATKSVLTCSLSALVQSAKPATLGGRLEKAFSQTEQVWREVASLPVILSTCASLNGQLIAVGGLDSDAKKTTNSVYAYDPTTDRWDVISTMPTARSRCLVAVLPGNQLMVVGGFTDSYGSVTDKVEVATF